MKRTKPEPKGEPKSGSPRSEAGAGSMQATVIAEMRGRIIRGDVEPGTSLSEAALAEEFGVSRTPVREALKQLQTEGLVEIRPRVGTFVTIPSRREITELFEMKELLEGAAARLLAQRGRVPEIDSMERNLREADAAVERDDRERYAALVQEFHDLLIAGSDNSKLQAHYRILMNQLAYSRLVNTSLSQPGRASQSDREHHLVLELILEKDGDSAERVMREHVRASRRALLAGLPVGGRREGFDGTAS
ncbi:GntR family transcriptional regulator [Streptomyces fuscichromogenes]|uniref:GntR family transcriptional regulator n=1 Tax=Streptomyces fuscichromogenes TaxID=1324013 RepID=UPI0038060BAF